MIGRELLKISNEHRDFPHKLFMNVGAMGHTSAIAKGIALAKKKTKVVCFDGDGSLAMHFGSLTMLNDLPNFKHILINNFSHDSVGGGRTSFGDHDLSVVLDNFNFGRYHRVLDLNQGSTEKVKLLLNNFGSCMVEYICSGRDSHSLPRPVKTLRELAANFRLDF
jgi:phosphonopyruvate decarboxylase